jgi:hypothetical protein
MTAVQDVLNELRKEIDGGIIKAAPVNYTVRPCPADIARFRIGCPAGD